MTCSLIATCVYGLVILRAIECVATCGHVRACHELLPLECYDVVHSS